MADLKELSLLSCIGFVLILERLFLISQEVNPFVHCVQSETCMFAYLPSFKYKKYIVTDF